MRTDLQWNYAATQRKSGAGNAFHQRFLKKYEKLVDKLVEKLYDKLNGILGI